MARIEYPLEGYEGAERDLREHANQKIESLRERIRELEAENAELSNHMEHTIKRAAEGEG